MDMCLCAFVLNIGLLLLNFCRVFELLVFIVRTAYSSSFSWRFYYYLLILVINISTYFLSYVYDVYNK